MTTTFDPKHAAYHDEADTRAELSRVFDVCGGCRRCVSLCTSFPSLFKMLDAVGGRDAGVLTPAQQDCVVDECFQCRRCTDNCPYVPGAHELAIDFRRSMARTLAMRHAAGQRTARAAVADHLLGHTDGWGKAATRTARLTNRVIVARPGTLRRTLLRGVTGISARRRLTPYARRSTTTSMRRRAQARVAASHHRRVTLLPTCLVEYRRPQIGHALVEVYARCGIACHVASAGCCGAPWLTAGDTRRFARQAVRTIELLAGVIRGGTDVVVAQPACHTVITTDYLDHIGGADAELVASRTFEALDYLARAVPTGSLRADRSEAVLALRAGDGQLRVAHHESWIGPDDTVSPAQVLLAASGFEVTVVRRRTGIDGRWGLRAANERIALAVADEIGVAIRRSGPDIVTGSCVLANTAIAEQTGLVALHPFELLAGIDQT